MFAYTSQQVALDAFRRLPFKLIDVGKRSVLALEGAEPFMAGNVIASKVCQSSPSGKLQLFGLFASPWLETMLTMSAMIRLLGGSHAVEGLTLALIVNLQDAIDVRSLHDVGYPLFRSIC